MSKHTPNPSSHALSLDYTFLITAQEGNEADVGPLVSGLISTLVPPGADQASMYEQTELFGKGVEAGMRVAIDLLFVRLPRCWPPITKRSNGC